MNPDRDHQIVFFNELLLSESDSSDDDVEEGRGIQVLRPRVRNYIEDVVDSMSESEFRENFRIYRRTCEHLIALIGSRISTEVYARGRHTIQPKQQILIALWYFATPDSFRSICGRFDVGRATSLRCVRRVANTLCSIASQIIIWPDDEQYRQQVIGGFSEMGFPNTIGCIDGMHVKIPFPKDHGLAYVCRKNFPAVILQAVCDHTMKFTHCYAGEAGSCHDARVLKQSEIWTWIMEREEKFPNNTHIIGDKAYPCLSQLITPFRDNGHLTNRQRTFNFLQSRARSTIERSFGLLQKRWGFLKDTLDVRKVDLRNIP